ncbi:MAG: hypothetical protein FWE69_00065 [Clostridiales bacterium]|nr:hypothetical protein [Clostridiales bacterium]
MAEYYESEKAVSVGNWIGTFFLTLIPVVNIIMLFVWAFGAQTKSKRNYGRAMLWMTLILAVAGACLIGAFAQTILGWLAFLA